MGKKGIYINFSVKLSIPVIPDYHILFSGIFVASKKHTVW